MADISPELKTKAKAHLAAIEASPEFRSIEPFYFAILSYLYDRWAKELPEEAAAKDIMDGVADVHLFKTKEAARKAVGRLRDQLEMFNLRTGSRSFARFDIPRQTRAYKLNVTPLVPTEDIARVLLNHRAKHSEKLKELVCAPADDILFVAFSPAEVLRNDISSWLTSGDITASVFRILLWNPKCPIAIAAMAAHIDGDQFTLGLRIAEALSTASKLKGIHPSQTVRVRHYRTVPTMLGICNGTNMTVEPIPFHRKGARFHECGALLKRPALFLNVDENPSSFGYFQNWFEDLWTASEPDQA